MAWHSKRHNIRHKKALTDAKKSKAYTKVAKIIVMAAKWWADPSMNPSLAAALDKARYNSLPKEVIQKAIAKWSGSSESANMVELFYEWYWPGWAALYIKCLTDNTNRTASNVRSNLGKLGWNIWEPGSVSRQFVEQWFVYISWLANRKIVKWNEVEEVTAFDIDQLEEDLMDMSIEDYQIDEWICRVITSKANFLTVKKQIEDLWYKIDDADLKFESTSPAEISEEDMNKLERIIEVLEEDDDVDTVYNNVF
jgi:YebC/PmpR family DNA-binding regulatory protein